MLYESYKFTHVSVGSWKIVDFSVKCTFEGGMCDEWKGPDANTGWVFEMIGERMDYEWEVVRGPQHRLVSNIDLIHKIWAILYGSYH